MRLVVGGNFIEGLEMELLGDDTDKEKESSVSINDLITLIMYIMQGVIMNINKNSDDLSIHTF